ncbi:vanadium-dependent haloperoxidase [Pirellulales bacterium]|nr:vanadium-dependent haloperoxidase [Pirellulales bacterium]
MSAKFFVTKPSWRLLAMGIAWGLSLANGASAQNSVARQWNEVLLEAIRRDFPAPTVHARNLYHASAAMYDAWAVFDKTAQGYFYSTKHSASNVQAAREEALSYAAYRVLSERYAQAVHPVASQSLFDGVMTNLGYDKNVTAAVGNSPAAIGNRIADQILTSQLNDGSNEANRYADNTGYLAANNPMIVDFPAVLINGTVDPNRWQPLFINSLTNQNGIPLPFNLQTYVGPHWGNVSTFALGRDGSGPQPWSEIDPGAPPQLGGVGEAEYRDSTMEVIRYSHSLDPSQGPGIETMNISPNTAGNRILGTHDDRGYAVNPATGLAYEDNLVKAADYGRVLAEFWADGPESETPPGHWNVLANEVSDSPLLEKRIGGVGPVVDDLEWDVKLGFALNGAVHDAAVAAWGTKRQYDYTRPITMIRYQGSLGQSSSPSAASYHPDGLPLEAGLIEVITAASIAPEGKHRNAFVNANTDDQGNLVQFITEEAMVGKIAVNVWNHAPSDPATEVSGVDWTLAENWVPYQMDNFVTPAFAAYVSGHSTFSRAAAEVLTLFTGSEYFPGGLGEVTFSTDFLDFEVGPSEELTLQWATYFDAADEAGISRLWGGIHVPADDFAGRVMGSSIGIEAFRFAQEHFRPAPEPSSSVPMFLACCLLLAKRKSIVACRKNAFLRRR